ncbi:Ankyrin-2 [Dactylella cylindrospora]|nr:Ankyrin-2 [Dactylella cylindrospora]
MEPTNSLFLAAKDGKVQDILYFLTLPSTTSPGPNTKGCGGYTPLHIACAFGHASAVKTLLIHGGDPEQQTDDGKTALNVAEEKGFGEVVEIIKSEEWKKDREDFVKA